MGGPAGISAGARPTAKAEGEPGPWASLPPTQVSAGAGQPSPRRPLAAQATSGARGQSREPRHGGLRALKGRGEPSRESATSPRAALPAQPLRGGRAFSAGPAWGAAPASLRSPPLPRDSSPAPTPPKHLQGSGPAALRLQPLLASRGLRRAPPGGLQPSVLLPNLGPEAGWGERTTWRARPWARLRPQPVWPGSLRTWGPRVPVLGLVACPHCCELRGPWGARRRVRLLHGLRVGHHLAGGLCPLSQLL